ncbi:hypothetical protein HELRODRAFT_85096, partial [Helobdella robusta]|uniref:EF-hand domain-containing protein n=1 Tax=Helobdella robusta TaxID=6412 RepID=T1G5S7_HELRO
KQIFSKYEDPTNGLVSVSNLATMLRSLGQNPTDSDIASMTYQLNDVLLKFDDFCLILLRNAKTKEEMRAEYIEAFRLFDTNNDGFVYATDIRKMMEIVGANYDEAELTSLFREYDKNMNGQIYYEGHRYN